MFEFSQPRWLLLLVPLLGLAFFRRRTWQSESVRLITMVVLVLALAGLRVSTLKWVSKWVVAYDTSHSVGEAGARLAEDWFTDHPSAIAWMPFAATAGRPKETPSRDLALDAEQTDLAAAITAARALPGVTGIVLLTDGRATTGDALAAAEQSTVPISVVPVVRDPQPEVQLLHLSVPDTVQVNIPFEVTLSIFAEVRSQGTITLTTNATSDPLVHQQIVSLVPGYQSIPVSCTLNAARLTSLEVTLDGFPDQCDENNHMTVLIEPTPPPRVLVVDTDPVSMQPFQQVLQSMPFSAKVIAPDELANRALAIRDTAAIVLGDVAAAELTLVQQLALRDYVMEFDGRLLMLGGPRGFGAGGWSASPLAEVLPVSCDFERTEQVPRVSLVFALDRSSSMSGGALAMAKAAILATWDSLTNRDQVGVLAFDIDTEWLLPLAPVDGALAMASRLSPIGASGGTSLAAALATAQQSLAAADTEIKHVVLLSDGHAAGDDLSSLAANMQSGGITLSTVAVGTMADQQLLTELADAGGGRPYFCPDPAAMTQLCLQDLATTTEAGIVESPFYAQVHESWEGIDLEAAPPLYGFVKTRLKPSARLILSTESGDPLLIEDNTGKVLAFTSDAKPRWSKDWYRWSSLGTFWSSLIRGLVEEPHQQYSRLGFNHEHNRLRVWVDLVTPNRHYDSDAFVALEVTETDGGRKRWPLELVAPGHYTTVLPDRNEALWLAVEANGKLLQRTTIPSAYPTELRFGSADWEQIREIAHRSGGTSGSRDHRAFAASATPFHQQPGPVTHAASVVSGAVSDGYSDSHHEKTGSLRIAGRLRLANSRCSFTRVLEKRPYRRGTVVLIIALGICWAAVVGLCRGTSGADRGLSKSRQEWQAGQAITGAHDGS